MWHVFRLLPLRLLLLKYETALIQRVIGVGAE